MWISSMTMHVFWKGGRRIRNSRSFSATVFEASLSYMRPCLKQQQQQQNKATQTKTLKLLLSLFFISFSVSGEEVMTTWFSLTKILLMSIKSRPLSPVVVQREPRGSRSSLKDCLTELWIQKDECLPASDQKSHSKATFYKHGGQRIGPSWELIEGKCDNDISSTVCSFVTS